MLPLSLSGPPTPVPWENEDAPRFPRHSAHSGSLLCPTMQLVQWLRAELAREAAWVQIRQDSPTLQGATTLPALQLPSL